MELRDFFKNLFKGREKKQPLTQASTMTGYTPQFSTFGNDVNASDLVIESIRLKVDYFSRLIPRYIKTTKGIQEHITDHTIAKVLRNPNPYMTTADFLAKACFLREVNKNVFIYPDYYNTVGGERKYTGLYILQPTNWRYYEYNDGSLAVGMRFGGQNSEEIVFEYADLIHWRKHFENNDYDGGAQGQPSNDADLLNTLQAYRTICESIAEAAKCACYFDGILKVNGFGAEDKKVQAIRDKFIADLRTGKTGVGVLDNGAEWQDIKRNLQMVNAETMKHFTNKILIHTGVSMAMLSGDFTPQQERAFINRCIESAAITLAQAMTKCFFSQWQQSNGQEIRIRPDALDNMSIQEANETMAATGAAGVWSKNEIRRMYGAPPIEGGDVYPRGFNNLDGSSEQPTGQGSTGSAVVNE